MEKTLGIVAAIVALMALLVGGGMVMAADSLPGDALYPVKLGVERVELRLARSPEAQVRAHLKFARRRAEELAVLGADGRLDEATLAQMEDHLLQAAALLKQVPEGQRAPLFGDLAGTARFQAEVLERLQGRMKASGHQALIERALEAARKLHEAAARRDLETLRAPLAEVAAVGSAARNGAMPQAPAAVPPAEPAPMATPPALQPEPVHPAAKGPIAVPGEGARTPDAKGSAPTRNPGERGTAPAAGGSQTSGASARPSGPAFRLPAPAAPGVSPYPTPTTTPSPTPTIAVPTPTPTVTVPTPTPEPTIVVPTETPEPTYTPEPTHTPEPGDDSGGEDDHDGDDGDHDDDHDDDD